MENCTQVIEGSFLEDIDPPDSGRLKVGSLSIYGVLHDIFKGENVIGRDELSDITITSNAISSKHAVIEVEDWDTHLLYDCGSTNKTRLGKMVLKPNVRYNLQGGDDIMFADLKATYTKLDKPETVLNDEDSGSETGSESMLNLESVDLAVNLAEDDSKHVQKNPPTVMIGSDQNQSGDTSDTLNHINESSVFEERKEISATSGVQVVEDSVDDSTDDEDDFFVLPSQTVKEFNSSRHESKTPNKTNRVVDTVLTEDIFDPVFVGKQISNSTSANKGLEMDSSMDIFEMETQEQDVDSVFKKQIIPIQKRFVDINSQYIFNTEAQVVSKFIQNTETDVSIFEAETQGVELNKMVSKKEDKIKEQRKYRNAEDENIFDAETEMPDCELDSDQSKAVEENKVQKEAIPKEVKPNNPNNNSNFVRDIVVRDSVDDLEKSDLAISSVLTEVNTRTQTQKSDNILENASLLKTHTKNPDNTYESNDSKQNFSTDYKLLQLKQADSKNSSENEKESFGTEGPSTVRKSSDYGKKSPQNSVHLTNTPTNSTNLPSQKNCEEPVSKNVIGQLENKTGISDDLTQVNIMLLKSDSKDTAESISDALTQFNTGLEENSSKTLETKEFNGKHREGMFGESNEVNEVSKDTLLHNTPPSKKKSTTLENPFAFSNALTQVNSVSEKIVSTSPSLLLDKEKCIETKEYLEEEDKVYDNISANDETQVNVQLHDKKRNNKKSKPASTALNRSEKEMRNIEAELTQPNLNLAHLFEEQERGEEKFDDLAEAETQPYLEVKTRNVDGGNYNTDVEDNNKSDEIRDLITSPNKLSDKPPSVETNREVKNDNFGVDESSNESDSLLASMLLDVDNVGIELLSPKDKGVKEGKFKEEVVKREGMIFETVNKTKIESCLKPSQEKYNNNFTKGGQEAKDAVSTLTVADMEICSTVGDSVSSSSSALIKSEVKITPSQSAQRVNTSLSTKRSFKNLEQKMSLIVEEKFLTSKKINSKCLFGEDQDKGSDITLNQSIFLNEPCFSSTPFKSEHEKILKYAEPSKQDTLKTPTKNIQFEIQDGSPLLPSTEELIGVADKTPDFKHDTPSDKKKKNMLPLALKRTPRAKKLSRKMAEHLEFEKNKLNVEELRTEQNCNSSEEHKKSGDSNKNIELKSFSVRIVRNCDSILEAEKSMGIEALKKSKSGSKFNKKKVLNHQTTTIKVLGSEEKDINEESCKVLTTEIEEKQLQSPSKAFNKLQSNCKGGKSDEFSLKSTPEKVMSKTITTKLTSKRLKHINESADLVCTFEKNTMLSKKESITDKPSEKTEQRRGCRLEKNTEVDKQSTSTSLRISKRNAMKQKTVSEELDSPEKVLSKNPRKNLDLPTSSKRELTLFDRDTGANDCNMITNSFSIEHSIKVGLDNSIPLSKSEKSTLLETELHFNKPEKFTPKKKKYNQKETLKVKQQQDEQPINSKQRSTRTQKLAQHLEENTNVLKQESSVIEDKSRVSRSTKRNHLPEPSPQNAASPIISNHHNSRKQKINSANDATTSVHSVKELDEPQRKSRKVTSSLLSSYERCKGSEENIAENSLNKNRKQKRQIIIEDDIQCTNDITDSDTKTTQKGKNNSKEKLLSTLVSKIENCVKNKSQTSQGRISDVPMNKISRSRKEKSQIHESKQKTAELSTESDSLKELTTIPNTRNKRKMKEEEKTGPSIKNSKTYPQASVNKRKDEKNMEDGLNKISRENKESTNAGYETGGKRTRVKPARYRENKDRLLSDSSVIEKSPLLSTRKKALGMSDSSETVGSISLEQNLKKNSSLNDSTFAVPPKSNSRKNGKQSVNDHSDPVPESKGRGRYKSKQSRANSVETSRSRSGSFSSQSSVKSDHSLTPRRSIKRGEKVLFTALSNQALESDIIKLGGSVVDCPSMCSVLVTDKVRRTVKFLCVLAQGKPIVTPDWIVQSYRCCAFQEPAQYLLKDSEAEQKFSFNLEQTMHLAKGEPLLRGYTVHATPSVKPPPDDIKSIVESCGGEYTITPPAQWPAQSVIISHPEDKAMWKRLKVKGVTPPIMAAEMLLLGVLQHNLDLTTHRIV